MGPSPSPSCEMASATLAGGDKRRSRDNSIFGMLQLSKPTEQILRDLRSSRISDCDGSKSVGTGSRRTSKRKSGTLRQSAKRKSKRNSGDSESGLFGNFLGHKLGGFARNAARSVRAQ